MRWQKWEASISVLGYTSASLPFFSFPYKYPPFFEKYYGEKQEEMGRENSEIERKK